MKFKEYLQMINEKETVFKVGDNVKDSYNGTRMKVVKIEGGKIWFKDLEGKYKGKVGKPMELKGIERYVEKNT